MTITSRASPDEQIDLKRSMDALKSAVAPLYDNLTMATSVGSGASKTLSNVNTSLKAEHPSIDCMKWD